MRRNIFVAAYKGIPMALPWWVETLQQAAEWSTPPWILNGDGLEVVWLLRWRAWRSEIASAERKRGESSTRRKR